MTTGYLYQSHTAVVAFSIVLAAFALVELPQMLRLRRGARSADLLGEVLFRLLFFGAILALPLCLSVAPGAVISGRAVTFA